MLKQTLNKGISTPIAIAIVLILVIIVGSFTWWQYGEIRKEETELPEIEIPEKEKVESKTTDWKTYTKTGYWGNICSIEYPDDWELVDDNYLTPKNKVIPEDIWVTINCFSKEKGYINQNTGEDLLSLCQTGKLSLGYTERFEAIHSKQFCTLSADGSQIGTIMFQVRGGRQRMDYYISDDELEPEFNIFNQMLPTFKFIERDEAVDWNTYRNEEYGFEIGYPEDWIATSSENLPRAYLYPSTHQTDFGADPEIFISIDEEPYTLFLHGTWGIIPYSVANTAQLILSEDITINDIPFKKDYWLLRAGGGDSWLAAISFNTKYNEKYYTISRGITIESDGLPEAPYSGSEITNEELISGALNRIRSAKKAEFLNQILSTFRFINPVADYFRDAELQYEGEIQKENIFIALNDILDLSEEQLKEKRYKDYTGKENQWDLPTLIYRHFVPEWPGVTLGNNFFQDVKSEEVQEQVKQILERYFK